MILLLMGAIFIVSNKFGLIMSSKNLIYQFKYEDFEEIVNNVIANKLFNEYFS